MNSNNDSEISDNFSNFPAEQVATPVPESPDEITEESDNNESSSNSSLNENYNNNEVDADGMNKGEILMKSGEFGIVRASFNFFTHFYLKQEMLRFFDTFLNL